MTVKITQWAMKLRPPEGLPEQPSFYGEGWGFCLCSGIGVKKMLSKIVKLSTDAVHYYCLSF